MQSAKGTASNVAASAKSGMEKTKAVAQEKAEKMTTSDPIKKDLAEQKKEARIHEAERMKAETRAQNLAAKQEQGHGTGLGHGLGLGHDTGTTGTTNPAGVGHTAAGAGVTGTGTGTTGVRDPRVTGTGHNTGIGSGGTGGTY